MGRTYVIVLIALAFVTAAAPAAPAAGPASAAHGTVTHTYDAPFVGRVCGAEGDVTVIVDHVAGAALVTASTDCAPPPDQYFPGECATDAAGAVRCAYTTSTGLSSVMTLGPDGAFSHTYRWTSGGVERLSGTLLRA